MTALNQNCSQITPFVNALCTRYPSVNFLKVLSHFFFMYYISYFLNFICVDFTYVCTKVDVNENPAVAKAENVRIVPTFKIYKNGTRVKEMICPSQQVLEYSVKHYGF